MGFIHEPVGRISIETRRESFIVHAGYGYVPGRRELHMLKIGDEFEANNDAGEPRRWCVSMMTEDIVAGREVVSSVIKEWPAMASVIVPGLEEDAEGPHAKWWRTAGHPEFANEDLDDLIAALTNMKKERR